MGRFKEAPENSINKCENWAPRRPCRLFEAQGFERVEARRLARRIETEEHADGGGKASGKGRSKSDFLQSYLLRSEQVEGMFRYRFKHMQPSGRRGFVGKVL